MSKELKEFLQFILCLTFGFIFLGVHQGLGILFMLIAVDTITKAEADEEP